MNQKKVGRDCWYPGCERTVDDEPLFRTRPKGESGDFMCAEHAVKVCGWRSLAEQLPKRAAVAQ